MKLGFLLFDYFPYGGLQRDCLKVARVCAGRGHEVAILTRTWQGTLPDDVRVELFGRSGVTNVARNRAWLKQLAGTLPQRGLDGVIGFNKMPGLDVYYGSDPCYAAKVSRIKPFWYRWLPRYRHFKGLEEAVFRHGSRTNILLLTAHEIPAYRDFYGTEPERFQVLPPGIERRSFAESQQAAQRIRLRREHGWPANERLLLFVGSGFRVKGLDRAIRALAALPPEQRRVTQLVVIGQNRPTEFLWLARRLHVSERIHFLGGRDDVFTWLLAADLLVHPARSEAAGLILLEALTAGLPVLTTDVCGYGFHIERAGAGLVLASPFEQQACNAALAGMLRTPDPASRANALRYASSEDLYSCHLRAAELIEESIRQKVSARR